MMFSLVSEWHRKISIAVSVALFTMGWLTTRGSAEPFSIWYAWGTILLILTLRFRHPPLYDRWHPLDGARIGWTIVALVIFAACFTPWPVQ